jgi:hypothetical protein
MGTYVDSKPGHKNFEWYNNFELNFESIDNVSLMLLSF